jgi:hypothetical protein
MSDIPAQFKALKLYGMASCYTELRQQYTPHRMADFDSADQILSQLLQAESTERNIRSIRYQTQAARFPVQRHLQGFDSVSPKSINNWRPLHGCNHDWSVNCYNGYLKQ